MQLVHKGAVAAVLLGAVLVAACLPAADSPGMTVQGTTNFDDLAVSDLAVGGNLAVAGALTAVGGPVSLGAAELSLGDVALAGNGTQISVRDAEQVVELGNTDAGIAPHRRGHEPVGGERTRAHGLPRCCGRGEDCS